jgi:peptidoglycan/xylan/chitin deacetylase (PgdA/CDA1 family)
MQGSGLTRLMELLPAEPGILVINHQRIGDASSSRFDHGVFSATPEQLDFQVRSLKRTLPIVGGDELIESLSSGRPLKYLYIAFTFDNGYLDNYTHAFEVLKANHAGGFFFLVPDYIGTSTVPWWDAIAYLVRNSPQRELNLTVPVPLTVTLDTDREPAIHQILQHYKRADNTDQAAFLRELQTLSGCTLPETERRFLDWTEASTMRAAGMTIGSHTCTNRILAQLPAAAQQQELTESRAILAQRLNTSIDTLAYPVGIPSAFTSATEALAHDAGYKLCFSSCGGVNPARGIRSTNILRTSVETDPTLFRNQMAWLTRFAKLPYSG